VKTRAPPVISATSLLDNAKFAQQGVAHATVLIATAAHPNTSSYKRRNPAARPAAYNSPIS